MRVFSFDIKKEGEKRILNLELMEEEEGMG